jgi:CRP/FNR family transcriptional regulator
MSPEQTLRFEQHIQQSKSVAVGEHLFRVGDNFESMFAVGSGCFKTYAIDAEGREHVLNFHFAGELIGIDAIYSERHMSNAVALEKSTVCVIPFHAISKLAHDIPELQTQLFRILSRDLIGSTSIAGDFTAEERLAAFLVMLSVRMQHHGAPSVDLELAMSRRDIANYLRLATETISRLLKRFQQSGLLQADRRHITLLDLNGLMQKADCMNPWSRWNFSAKARPDNPLEIN